MAFTFDGVNYWDIPNDETEFLYKLCNSLSDDKKIQKRLQDDYRYQLKKNKNLFNSIAFDENGKKHKTVKKIYFYSWFLSNRDKKYPEIGLDKIPKEYKKDVYSFKFTLENTRIDEIESYDDIELVKEAYRKLREENKLLKDRLNKKFEINKKKGRRTT